MIAVKQPAGRPNTASMGAKVTSSGGRFTLEQLTNGSIADAVLLPRDDRAGFSWIQFEYPEPVTIKSIQMVGAGGGGFGGGPATTQLESEAAACHKSP